MPAGSHTVQIAKVEAGSGTIGGIEITKVAGGAVTVGKLSLNGTSMTINSGSALLQNVRFILQLSIALTYSYDILGFKGKGSDHLGTISFAINAGDVVVPSLNNIELGIPNLTASDVGANLAAIANLALGGANLTGFEADGIKLPSSGFQLGGLTLGPVTIADLEVPDALVGSVSIQDFNLNGNLVVPEVQLNQIKLPAAAAADIQSQAPFAIHNIQASSQGKSAGFGPFSIGISITPTINTSIGALTLSNVSVAGSVASGVIQNVSVPISIGGIDLNTISIAAIDVSNIAL